MKTQKAVWLLILFLAFAATMQVGCSGQSGVSPLGPESVIQPANASQTADDDDGDDAEEDDDAEEGDDDDDTFLAVAQRDPDEEGVSTALIGPLGGEVTLGDHRVVIPAGALNETIEIKFTVPPSDTLMFDLEPHGTQFNVPVSLIFEYDNADLTGVNEEALELVGYYNPSTGVWEHMPTVVDPVNDVIIGYTDHFSRYAIIRK